jgi:hypothetical protein
LANGNSYDFRVSAVNAVGQGIATSPVSATPGPPAQVLIQSFSGLTTPTISTAVRITNEGATAYEYTYTWCVTNNETDQCGGSGSIFSSTDEKLIQPGQNFDTVLNSTVPSAGNYWFHLAVQFGSSVSEADQSFTATAPASGGGGGGGGGSSGGGGGGGGTGVIASYIPPTSATGSATSTVISSNSTSGSSTLAQEELLNLLITELQALLKEAQAQGITIPLSTDAYLNGESGTYQLSAIPRDLTIGSTGADVTSLQEFLVTKDVGPDATALANVGATGYFGLITQAALAEYQATVGITPAQGYFGPITRAYLRSIGD